MTDQQWEHTMRLWQKRQAMVILAHLRGDDYRAALTPFAPPNATQEDHEAWEKGFKKRLAKLRNVYTVRR